MMNKYTVTIQIEVEVTGGSESFARDHALECVDEYDGDTKITECVVVCIETTDTECELCGDWFEPEEEWVGLCEDCREK
jgi:hypothetical protein